jgi:CubicO group peptidase (beta-lactamase class C family)
MIRFKHLITLVLLFVFVLGCEKKFCSVDDFSNHLDNRIPLLMERFEVPGTVVALIKDGKTVWEKSYGYADAGLKKKLNTTDLCMVHSISKSLTAWGVMKLVQDGKIDLDEPVYKYFRTFHLPDDSPYFKKITTRDLLSNSSGLGLGTIGVHYFSSEERPLLRDVLLSDLKVVDKPGRTFIYSNAGFNLLELLIEEVTGENFAIYMEKAVLLPLGMTNSGFQYSPDQFPDIPKGYKIDGEEIPVYFYAGNSSGGLFSTVGDIAKFVSASITKFNEDGLEVLSSEFINEIHAPQIEMSGLFSAVFDSYGFGHFIETLPNGMKAVSHGGQGLGWMTHFHFVPETGDGIVIFANSQRSWPMFSVVLEDWAQFNRFDSVGMGIIAKGDVAVWIMINIIIFFSFLMLFRLLHGIFSGKRRFDPFSQRSLTKRIVQFVISIDIYIVLIWSISQDYLFITSIFPAATPVLACSSFFFATVLLLNAFFIVEENHRNY